jgi:hypothetical protein
MQPRGCGLRIARIGSPISNCRACRSGSVGLGVGNPSENYTLQLFFFFFLFFLSPAIDIN